MGTEGTGKSSLHTSGWSAVKIVGDTMCGMSAEDSWIVRPGRNIVCENVVSDSSMSVYISLAAVTGLECVLVMRRAVVW